jgi:hypothetical protein
MSILKDTMQRFGDRKSEFRKNYTLGTTTHLLKVSSSICMFDELTSKIRATQCENVDNLEEILNKIKSSNRNLSDRNERIIRKLINLEYFNKDMLKKLLKSEIIENSRLDEYMQTKIKTEKQGLDFATSIAIIDDYENFLESGSYSGPTDLV